MRWNEITGAGTGRAESGPAPHDAELAKAAEPRLPETPPAPERKRAADGIGSAPRVLISSLRWGRR